MNLMEKAESQAYKTVSHLIVKLLDSCSDSTLLQLTSLAKKLTADEEVLSAIRAIERMLANPLDSSRQLFKRVMNYLSYENKQNLFYALFNNAWFEGREKKRKIEEELGFWPPFVLILSPTLNCNLRCKGCYTLGYGMKHELPYEIVDRILTECEGLGIYLITVLGGEPLAYPHLFRMIEEHPKLLFQVYTNGTMIDRSIAQRFRADNVIVIISIEGHEGDTDAWRGKGVYNRIMEAFDLLTDEHVIVGSSATVTSRNIEVASGEPFVDFMIEKGSLIQMYFLYMPVNGRSDFSLLVTPEQRDLLRRRVIEYRKTKPLFFVDFWNDGPNVGGCIAGGRKYLHINAKGDIEPCVYTHIATHNIRNSSIREALASELFQAIRTRQPYSSNHLKPCMILDNPEVMRTIIRQVKPYYTHPGADEIYSLRACELDEYAQTYSEYIDKIWEEEYVQRKLTDPPTG